MPAIIVVLTLPHWVWAGRKGKINMEKTSKFFLCLLLAVAAAGFAACSGDDGDDDAGPGPGQPGGQGGGTGQFTPDLVIDVENSGTLPDLISEADMFRVKSLRVTGVLNGTDIDFLQRMVGDGHYDEPVGVLENIDMGDARIVAGGKAYYESRNVYGDPVQYYTDYDMIGSRMFYSYPSLKCVILPKGIKKISDDAFNYCTGLATITIPAGVESMSHYSFGHCSGLKSVYMEGATPPGKSFYSEPFTDCTATLYVPRDSKGAYEESWMGRSGGVFHGKIVEYDK